jgi:hypothetical protein
VDAYAEGLDVPQSVAEEDLQLQAMAGEADIVGALEDRLNETYSCVWFDSESSEYVVPMTTGESASNGTAYDYDDAGRLAGMSLTS